MNIQKIQDMLIKHEGYRRFLYKCTAGVNTVGIGRNLDSRGISLDEALVMLDNDIRLCVADLPVIFSGFDDLPENIKMVLIDMMFNLGPQRFRQFKKMIAAVKINDWPEMIKQMKDSRWYQQVPNRANDLIGMIEAM